MHSLDGLHLAYSLTPESEARLRQWDEALEGEPPLQPMRWHVYLEGYLRSATVRGSTHIEGNPLTLTQVDALLRGDTSAGHRRAQIEVQNYNHALDLATGFALTPSFLWGESVLRVLNHEILRDLPDDRQGRYREQMVRVGTFEPPAHQRVPGLMAALMDWLRVGSEHPLVRIALLHLNLVAIHPWLDGNGRTARVASSLEIMRCRVGAPELISVDSYLAEHIEEYFATLSEALGERYDPERHVATPWVNYLIGVYADRLGFEDRMREAWPHDAGTVADALDGLGHNLDWGPVILMAAIAPVRTRIVAQMIERTPPTARAMLSAMAAEGWLVPVGRTRTMSYHAGPRIAALMLRSPAIVGRYVAGQTLGLEAA